jgi:hypothetical protein
MATAKRVLAKKTKLTSGIAVLKIGVGRGTTKSAAHKSNTPGALCFVGVCLGSWAEFERYVRSTLGPIGKLDPLQQLEVEVCARHFIEARAAIDALF